MTLTEILAQLSDLDRAAEPSAEQPFPPDRMSAEEAVEELRSKVDAIRLVHSRLKSEEARLRVDAAQILKSAQAIAHNRDRLETYICFAMKAAQFEQIPGNRWNVRIRPAQPSLIVDKDPTGEDYLVDPVLIVREVSYRWDKNKVKDVLKSGGTFRYGHLETSDILEFPIRKENP